MSTALMERVARIYAALGVAVEEDMTKLPTAIRQTATMVHLRQDFSGGQSQAEMENQAHSLIYNIAHLYDHLRKWAKAKGKDPDRVDEAVEQCSALQVMRDLSNVDKHGGPGRKTWSGKKLELANVTRVLRLTTRAEQASRSGARIGRIPRVFGDGQAAAILTGDVLDEDDNKIADLHELATQAIAAWEALLSNYAAA